jgi:hypothetical protein
MIVGGGGGAGEGCKGGESGGGNEGEGRARELVPRGKMTAFLLQITS